MCKRLHIGWQAQVPAPMRSASVYLTTYLSVFYIRPIKQQVICRLGLKVALTLSKCFLRLRF